MRGKGKNEIKESSVAVKTVINNMVIAIDAIRAYENGGGREGRSAPSRADVQNLDLRAVNVRERNRESPSLSIKSLKRSFVASDGTMDKTRG